MGRKSSSPEVPQRKKPYRAKKGHKSRIGCPNGKRWCVGCSERLNLESQLRCYFRNTFVPLKGQETVCPIGCECIICSRDSFILLNCWKFQIRRLQLRRLQSVSHYE